MCGWCAFELFIRHAFPLNHNDRANLSSSHNLVVQNFTSVLPSSFRMSKPHLEAVNICASPKMEPLSTPSSLAREEVDDAEEFAAIKDILGKSRNAEIVAFKEMLDKVRSRSETVISGLQAESVRQKGRIEDLLGKLATVTPVEKSEPYVTLLNRCGRVKEDFKKERKAHEELKRVFNTGQSMSGGEKSEEATSSNGKSVF
jgi:hypothetical protein